VKEVDSNVINVEFTTKENNPDIIHAAQVATRLAQVALGVEEKARVYGGTEYVIIDENNLDVAYGALTIIKKQYGKFITPEIDVMALAKERANL
jgi:hypothetical protein